MTSGTQPLALLFIRNPLRSITRNTPTLQYINLDGEGDLRKNSISRSKLC